MTVYLEIWAFNWKALSPPSGGERLSHIVLSKLPTTSEFLMHRFFFRASQLFSAHLPPWSWISRRTLYLYQSSTPFLVKVMKTTVENQHETSVLCLYTEISEIQTSCHEGLYDAVAAAGDGGKGGSQQQQLHLIEAANLLLHGYPWGSLSHLHPIHLFLWQNKFRVLKPLDA